MSYQYLDCRQEGAVHTVSLNRPQLRNAFNDGVIRELTEWAEDMRQGTFTITNVGPAGGWFGTSIIRHPESAILGVGRMTERPVVRDGRVTVGTVLPLALTFDHRVIDGDAALAFVQALRERLESPEQLVRDEPR